VLFNYISIFYSSLYHGFNRLFCRSIVLYDHIRKGGSARHLALPRLNEEKVGRTVPGEQKMPMKTQDLAFLHGLHTPKCHARVSKHFQDYYTLQLMEDGCLELFYEEERWLLEGTWFWPAYPGPYTRFHVGSGQNIWNHRYIAFKGPLANQWYTEGLYPMLPQSVSSVKAITGQFDELLREFHQPGQWHQLKAINILERILINLAEARHAEQTNVPWLESVLSEINKAPHFSVDYENIAQEHGMSLSTLRRKFRNTSGISIHRYVLQARITRARHWLGESDLPIKAIAELLGYSDLYFFARQFKKETGITPGAFRKSRQK